MKTKKIIALLILLFLTGCFCSYTVVHFHPNKKNDIVTINRIVQEVTIHWNSLTEGNYRDFQYPFCVLSSDDRLLYQSTSDAMNTVANALVNGDIIMDIEQSNEIVGKVIYYYAYRSSI